MYFKRVFWYLYSYKVAPPSELQGALAPPPLYSLLVTTKWTTAVSLQRMHCRIDAKYMHVIVPKVIISVRSISVADPDFY